MTMCCHWRPVCPALRGGLTLENLSWASGRTRPEAEAYLQEIFSNGFLRGRWAKQRFPGYLPPPKVLVVKGKMVK